MVSIKVTSIVPKPFDNRVFDAALRTKMRLVTGPKIKRDFKRAVQTWEHKPEFKVEINTRPDQVSVSVLPTGPNAAQFALVSEGSPPHQIIPKSGTRALIFQSGFISKTSPGNLTPSAGRIFGAPVATKLVNHPGFEGRKYGELIAARHKRAFAEDMQEAMNEAARRA